MHANAKSPTPGLRACNKNNQFIVQFCSMLKEKAWVFFFGGGVWDLAALLAYKILTVCSWKQSKLQWNICLSIIHKPPYEYTCAHMWMHLSLRWDMHGHYFKCSQQLWCNWQQLYDCMMHVTVHIVALVNMLTRLYIFENFESFALCRCIITFCFNCIFF